MTYRWAEHTGELELHIEASSREQLFADALAAFAELVRPDDAVGEATRHEIQLEAGDGGMLLAGWIEELVFLADSEGFVPEHVSQIDVTETSLSALVAGLRDDPTPLVKAVTYHNLELREEDDAFRARVVLDV